MSLRLKRLSPWYTVVPNPLLNPYNNSGLSYVSSGFRRQCKAVLNFRFSVL